RKEKKKMVFVSKVQTAPYEG
ncbi:hypothetical protein CCACVL1_23231, partial [Corchorus capsularis]